MHEETPPKEPVTEQQAGNILRVAAKAAIVNPDKKVLILREAASGDNTHPGKWGLPGGRIEDEPFMDGFRREIGQETGLTIVTAAPFYVGDWYPTIKEQPNHIIGMFMLCTTTTYEVDLDQEAVRESSEYAWIDPQNWVAHPEEHPMKTPDNLVIAKLASLPDAVFQYLTQGNI